MTASPPKGSIEQFRGMVRRVLAYRPPEKPDPTPRAKHRKASRQSHKKPTVKAPVR